VFTILSSYFHLKEKHKYCVTIPGQKRSRGPHTTKAAYWNEINSAIKNHCSIGVSYTSATHAAHGFPLCYE